MNRSYKTLLKKRKNLRRDFIKLWNSYVLKAAILDFYTQTTTPNFQMDNCCICLGIVPRRVHPR